MYVPVRRVFRRPGLRLDCLRVVRKAVRHVRQVTPMRYTLRCRSRPENRYVKAEVGDDTTRPTSIRTCPRCVGEGTAIVVEKTSTPYWSTLCQSICGGAIRISNRRNRNDRLKTSPKTKEVPNGRWVSEEEQLMQDWRGIGWSVEVCRIRKLMINDSIVDAGPCCETFPSVLKLHRRMSSMATAVQTVTDVPAPALEKYTQVQESKHECE